MDTQKVNDIITRLRSEGQEEDANAIEALLEECEDCRILSAPPRQPAFTVSFLERPVSVVIDGAGGAGADPLLQMAFANSSIEVFHDHKGGPAPQSGRGVAAIVASGSAKAGGSTNGSVGIGNYGGGYQISRVTPIELTQPSQ